MSRLDNFEEILKSYEGRKYTDDPVLFQGVPLLKSEYDALEALYDLEKICVDTDSIKPTPSPSIRIENERLVSLALDDLSLLSLAPEIGQLGNLYYLNLSYNQLNDLPEEICLLKELIKLDLSGNGLAELPALMKNLDNLDHMDIGLNRFKSLPDVLLEMPKLKTVYCGGNPVIYEKDPVLKKLQKRGIDITY